MQNRFRYKHFRWVCAALISIACLSPPVQQLASVPSELEVPLGGERVVHLGMPTSAVVTTSNDKVASARTILSSNSRDVAVMSRDIGDAWISTKLLGVFPWKKVQVHVMPQQKVYVGGQSVGIRLKTRGVLVVGFQRVGSTQKSPAADADIRLGDVIEELNHHTITSADDIRNNLGTGRGACNVVVRRGQDRHRVSLSPALDDSGTPHLGLYVRERTSGVGTLTYYDAGHHSFGALGHVITDADTGQPIVGTGSLFNAEVTGMVKGEAGKPGEKRGRFVNVRSEIGHIEKNCSFGVFGEMNGRPHHMYEKNELPVAFPSEVHEGRAALLTVVHGQDVQAFTVEIENLVKQDHPNTKSMIVHVTDQRLLNVTGGIVQGMSGSPLVQDGKLIGAVTHVFVSDPTRGYGVYAAWMLKEGRTSTAAVHSEWGPSQQVPAFS